MHNLKDNAMAGKWMPIITIPTNYLQLFLYFLKWKESWQCVKVVDTGTPQLINHDWSHTLVHYCFFFFFFSNPTSTQNIFFKKQNLISLLFHMQPHWEATSFFSRWFLWCWRNNDRFQSSGVGKAAWLIHHCCNQLVYEDGSFLTNQAEMSSEKS